MDTLNPTEALRAELKTLKRRDVHVVARLGKVGYRGVESFVSGRTVSPSVAMYEGMRDGLRRFRIYQVEQAKLHAKLLDKFPELQS